MEGKCNTNMFGISIIIPSMDIIMGITGGTEICATMGCSRNEKCGSPIKLHKDKEDYK